MKTVLELDFDPQQFINACNQAGDSAELLKDKFDNLSNDIKKTDLSKPVTEIMKFQKAFQNSLKAISENSGNTKEMITKTTSDITKYIEDLKKKLGELYDKDFKPRGTWADQESAEQFRAISDAIKTAEEALKNLNETTVETSIETRSARARLREMRNELIALEDAGQTNTERYRTLTTEAAQLTDQLGDQAEAIRVLSSDTYQLDATVDIIKQIANAWQLAEGAMALFGVENDDIQQSMQRLIAVQTVVNSLQEIHTFLTGQSAGALRLQAMWTALTTTAIQGQVTATGEAIVATNGLKVALASTGIGLLIVGIGALIAYWDDLSMAMRGTSKEADTLTTAQTEVKDSLVDMYETQDKQKRIFESAKNGTISSKDALKQYNETIKDTGYEFKNLSDAEKFYIATTDLFIKKTLARETALILVKKSSEKNAENLLIQQGKSTGILEDLFKAGETIQNKLGVAGGDQYVKSRRAQVLKNNQEEIDFNTKLADSQFKAEADIDKKILDNLKKSNANRIETEKGNTKDIKNIYAETRRDYLKTIQSFANVEESQLVKINNEAIANNKERLQKISDALKKGELTKLQAKDLRRISGLIMQSELKKEYADFDKERAEIIKQSNQDLQELQSELEAQKIENIVQDYDREIATINNEEKNKSIAIERARTDALDKLKSNKDAEYLTSTEYLEKEKQTNDVYNELILQNEYKSNEKRIKLNTEFLNTLSNQYNEWANATTEYARAKEIKEATIRNVGASEIEAINKKYDKRAKEDKINSLNSQIKQLEEANKTEIDLVKKKNNEIEIINKQAEVLKLETPDAQPKLTFFESLFGKDDKAKEKADATINLAKEVFKVTTDLIKQQAQLETQQYDNAIKLQQQRVTEAQKIADAGNSEYLQQEEDRLNQLEVKREASARRQLEIDAQIQASQILVAIAGAAAQIAKPGATTADVIAGITAVVGALGAGAQLVSQYQNSRPAFFEGTENVAQSLGKPQRSGRDGYDISVDGGERIVPSSINKLLEGIPNNQLPSLVSAGALALNFKPKDNNVDLERKFNVLAEQQALTNEYLKNLNINMNIDENGFGASLTTYQNRIKKQQSL